MKSFMKNKAQSTKKKIKNKSFSKFNNKICKNLKKLWKKKHDSKLKNKKEKLKKFFKT